MHTREFLVAFAIVAAAVDPAAEWSVAEVNGAPGLLRALGMTVIVL